MIPQKDRIEAAIRHIQTSADIDPWAMELAVEALKEKIDKDINVSSNDCISRQDAADIVLFECGEFTGLAKTIIKEFEELPSAQPEIMPDGTLTVTVDADIANVGRILLSQAGTQYGGLYYKDAQPEPSQVARDIATIIENEQDMRVMLSQPEIVRCKDCKYYEEINQPYPQMYCRKHSIDTSDQDFCSRAERKDDE